MNERVAHFTFGPRFFPEEGRTMFEFVIDHSNRLGPREATEADIAKYPEAFQAALLMPEPVAEAQIEPQIEPQIQPQIEEPETVDDRPRHQPWPRPKRK